MVTGFDIAAWVGWLLCIINLVSVARHPTAHFQRIGRSRWRWTLISLLGVSAFLGIFTSVAYFVRVSIWFPEKEQVPRPCSHHGRRECRRAGPPEMRALFRPRVGELPMRRRADLRLLLRPRHDTLPQLPWHGDRARVAPGWHRQIGRAGGGAIE